MNSLLLQRSNLSCKLTNHCNSCSRALFKSQTKEGPSEMRNWNMFFLLFECFLYFFCENELEIFKYLQSETESNRK